MMGLDGEIALVTGGTRGIGEAIVRKLTREGAKVVFTGRSEGGNAETIESEIRASGGLATFVKVEMGSEDEIRESFSAAAALYGPLTILVSNAAPVDQMHLDLGPEQTSAEAWDRLIRLNLTSAAFLPCKYALPSMIEAGKGSIIQISSLASLRAGGNLAYSAGKAACNALIAGVALQYAPNNIRANALALGYIPGPSTQSLEGMDEQFRRMTPLGSGRGDDVANLAAFIASDEARWITGQTIVIDGGLSSYLPGALDGSVRDAPLTAPGNAN